MQNPPEQKQTLCGGRRLNSLSVAGDPEHPLVTVVTAVYNAKQYLVGCLKSVRQQDYPNIEHIFLDGGSTDGTLEVLRQYEDQIEFWKSEPDCGVYDAWNKGLREARGEWICFLGADDELLPGAISSYMALARINPHAEYLSSQVRWVLPSGYERVIGGPWNWSRFSRWMCTAHVGSMHRRSLFDRLGTYDTSYRMTGDYELLLRARDQLKAAYMPVVTVTMRAGGVSDGREPLEEQARAKVSAGGRNKLLAAMELHFANVKFALRPLRYALGRIKLRQG